MTEWESAAHELDWEEEIASDGGPALLEEGDYNFTVTALERGRFPGGEKIPPCKKACLTLLVQAPEGEVPVRCDLLLWSTLEWKIAEFFRAIGQKRRGEPFRPRWHEIVGARGRGRFRPRTYIAKDGAARQVNDVERFYDYDERFFD